MADDVVVSAGTTAGVIAGIVICSLLFLIVLALIAYNIYLCQRRRANERAFRERAVKRPPLVSGWREAPLLYGSRDEGFKGSGTINKGYAPSMASVNTASTGRGVGPAPKADLDDMSDLDAADTTDAGDVPGRYLKPGRPALHAGKQTPGYYNDHNMPPGGKQTPGYYNHTTPRNGVPAYPNVNPNAQTERFPAHVRQEITLKPSQLEAQWAPGGPSGGGPQHYRGSPAYPMPRAGERGLRQTNPHRNSYMAVLGADTGRLSGSDVSITGCGAQYVPDISMSPTGNIHNGGIRYNEY